jgi:hypothetical protein
LHDPNLEILVNHHHERPQKEDDESGKEGEMKESGRGFPQHPADERKALQRASSPDAPPLPTEADTTVHAATADTTIHPISEDHQRGHEQSIHDPHVRDVPINLSRWHLTSPDDERCVYQTTV